MGSMASKQLWRQHGERQQAQGLTPLEGPIGTL
jgi:hypothetical protein